MHGINGGLSCPASEGYPAGVGLTIQGSTPEHVYYVEQGIVKLTRACQQGREVIVCLKRSGNLIGAQYAGLWEGCFETATTVTKCRLARWPLQEFLDKITRDRAFSFVVCQLLSHETRELHRRLASLALRTASQRLEDFLSECAAGQPDRSSTSDARLSLHLKDSELAQFLCVTPFYLSKLWRQLERKGTVTRKQGWIHLLKEAAGKVRAAHSMS
jgi:CRP/FNR family transcriptional regulator, cyclic AMP receptor protein